MHPSIFIKQGQLILAVLLLASVLSCKKDEMSIPDSDIAIDLSPVDVQGNINLPVSLDKIGDLKIISGFYEGKVSLSGNTGNLEAKWEIPLNQGTVQLVVLLNNDVPLGYAISVPNDPTTLNITPLSTSEAIILMHPFFVNNDLNEYKSVLNILKSIPSFNNLNLEVATAMGEGYFNFDAVTSLSAYFRDAIDNLFEVIENQQVGLEITNVDVTGNPSFQLINRRKRWVNVTAEKVKNNVATPVKIVAGERSFYNYPLPSDEISLLGANIYLEEISPVLVIKEADNADSITLSCYGPGINGFPSALSDFEKGVPSLVNTFLFDYLAPMLELKSGLKKGKLKQELRGRPNSTPIKRLVEKLENEFKKPETFLALSEAAIANQLSSPIDFFWIFFSKGLSVVESPENAKLIYDLLKGLVPKEDLKLIIVDIIPLLRKISLTLTLVNLQSAVYALFVSDWETKFTIRLVDEGEFKIFSNTCNYPQKSDRKLRWKNINFHL